MALTAMMGGRKVLARDVDRAEKGTYKCVICGEPVFVKKGVVRVHHFAHYPGAVCKSWEPESEGHLEMKQVLYDMLSKLEWVDYVELECVIDGKVADLVVKWCDMNIAVECQYSYKPIDDILEKTLHYNENGYYALWIFHSKVRSGMVYVTDEGRRYFVKYDDGGLYGESVGYAREKERYELDISSPFVCESLVRGHVVYSEVQ